MTMKKTYMTPALYVDYVQAEQMIAASITGIGGKSGVGLADKNDPVPGQADTKISGDWNDIWN